MYGGDHNPPHFHVRTPDGDAAVAIGDHRILVGNVDRRAMEEALAWVTGKDALLEAVWDELQAT